MFLIRILFFLSSVKVNSLGFCHAVFRIQAKHFFYLHLSLHLLKCLKYSQSKSEAVSILNCQYISSSALAARLEITTGRVIFQCAH